ncbi:hypothetical protein [Xanthomonas phage SB3]|uniref:Tail fiber protein n=1 Tax=Xanthomonas phage SB3 TaxID=3117472 RepID=A0ABZ2GY04_9CAUD
MINNGEFSRAPLRQGFVHPIARRTRPLTAYALGHAQLNDPAGPSTYSWFCEYADGAVWVSLEGSEEREKLFDREGITLVSFSFDLAMVPVVSFVDASGSWLWWYDSIAEKHVFTAIDGRTPFVAMDDRRLEQSAIADVILTYLRGDKVYQRIQRDRYTIEYAEQPLGVPITATSSITGFAMHTGNRMQWRIKP